MERGAAGAAPKNDGGKAVTCGVQERAAVAGNSEESARRRGKGRGGNPPRLISAFAILPHLSSFPVLYFFFF